MLIIHSCGDGESAHVPLTVVVHGGNIRRENRLGILVHCHGGIGPPQKSLRQRGTVVQLALDLNIGFVRIYGEGHFALGAVHLVHLGKLHGLAAIGVFRHAPVHGGKGGGTVVLGPVEFDAARNPRPDKPYKRRLNDFVVVNKVIAVCFVVSALNSAAQLGEHHHADVIVFQPYCGVTLFGFFVENLIDHRQRIHLAAGTLVYALFQKHGVLVRLADSIGGQLDLLNPDFSLTQNVFHCSALLNLVQCCCVMM